MKFKKLNTTLLAAAIITVGASLQSCNNDDDNYNASYYYPNMVVTVKKSADDKTYFQLDEKTTLRPTNISKLLYDGKEVRALANMEITNDDPGQYTKAAKVIWIDSIRTKATAPTLLEENDKVYGNDALEIMDDWYAIAEDGYLTLRIRTLWGAYQYRPTHYLNLITGVNPENPYEVELRHNANGDTGRELGDAFIAFNLSALPDTEGKTVKLKVRWKSFSGEKTAEFDYCTRKSTSKGTLKINNDDKQFLSAIK